MTQHAVALKFHKTCRADVTYIVQRPTVTQLANPKSHNTTHRCANTTTQYTIGLTQHATVVTQPHSVHRANTATQHATVLLQLHNTQSW